MNPFRYIGNLWTIQNFQLIIHFKIDGEITLGENIADNGGFKEAYYAYKRYVEQNGPEKYLPGMDQFTHEQLFFISFGNVSK